MISKCMTLLALAILSVGFIALLYLRLTHFCMIKKSGFDRTFLSKGYIIHRHILPYNSYYLAGATGSSVYLGNVIGTTKLLTGDSAFKNFIETEITIPEEKGIAWQALQTKVDSPAITTAEQITPRFYQGQIPSGIMERKPLKWPLAINAWLRMKGDQYILRMYDSAHDQYDLFKWEKDITEHHPNVILRKQGDGTFSLDGMLLYDKQTSIVLYVYYYRNEILLLDTNLGIKASLRTIDTVVHSDVQVATIVSTRTTTLKYPSLVINKRAAVCSGRLYVHSLRRADNQSQDDQVVIDCYDLISLKYLFSFYLEIDPKTLSGIIVIPGRMYAIAGKELLAIRLVP